MVEISTSILSINQEEIIKKIYDLEVAHTDYFHIDVMDGEFVKNNTADAMQKYAETIKQISNIPLDIHLMVKDIKKFINEYIHLNPNIITFQYEGVEDKTKIKEYINYIKQNNIKVGIAINPKTNIEEIFEYLPYIHTVLVMTVEAGEGGQELILDTLNKITKLKEYIEKNNIEIDIEADGGINLANIKEVVEAGADIAVVGTGIIKTNNYKETITKLKTCI